MFQIFPAAPVRKGQKPNPNFTQDDGIDDNLGFMIYQPVEDSRIWRWLHRLAQDVGIYEDGHSVSVDSDFNGLKNPFTGHLKSH
jgi:hypothetical protein